LTRIPLKSSLQKGYSFIHPILNFDMKKTLLFWFLIGSFPLLAQEDLTVIVRNALTNEPVPSIEVTLTNTALGYEQTLSSDDLGRAVFRNLLAADGYVAKAADNADYLGSETRTINIRSNENPIVDLLIFESRELSLDEVVVQAQGATQINRRDAEVSFELQQKEIEEIPIEGRDITRVLFRLPNVSQATGFYPEAPNVSINGANPLFTSYLIDGMDNNERFLGGQKFAIPSGFARNITVLTNNYSAEYGLTGNGVVNVTTRSGSNELTGEAFFVNRPGPVLDGPSEFAQRDLSGNPVKDGFQRYQAGVAMGGPIVKDKTFFYVDLEHTTDLKDNRLTSPALGVNEIIRGTNNFTYLSGKIDQVWSPNFRSSLRTNVGMVTIERQGGGLEGGVLFPSAANFQDRNSVLVASKNTFVKGNFSSQTNVQYARFRWNYGRGVAARGVNATVLDPADNAIAIVGHPDYIFDQTENTVQVQQKFRIYLDKHTLKTGLGVISADHELFGGGNESGNYRVRLTEDQLLGLQGVGAGFDIADIPADVEVLDYNVELRPASFGARQTIYSAYVEDQWAATDRLNLTLGLRYDYDDLSRGGGEQGDLNNLAPRFNFNYKLGQRSSLRGGYGVFYDKIPYAVYSDAIQQNTTGADYLTQLQALVDQGVLPADTDLQAITFEGNLVASANNVNFLEGPTPSELAEQRENVFSNERRILNPNGYQNPYTHQIAVGYQLQVNNQSLFYVDLVHNQSYNLLRLRNLNAVSSYLITEEDVEGLTAEELAQLPRSPAEADLTRPIPIYEGGFAVIEGDTLFGVARNIVMSETAGQSRYYAASFNLQKERGDDNWSYRINYTLSLLENNTEDINFRAMNANDFEAEWGPSINDRTHIINGIFNYYPTKGLSVTAAMLLQSGQPINRIPQGEIFGTTDLNGDGASFGDAYVGNSDRSPGESRNSDRLPWSNTFDVGIQYDFDFGGSAIELRADIFNVFNAQNLSGYSNNATQSNQIQPGSLTGQNILIRRNASAPRQFQFSLRYLF
jgi:outer membrane receptor protein involved in Fe transport